MNKEVRIYNGVPIYLIGKTRNGLYYWMSHDYIHKSGSKIIGAIKIFEEAQPDSTNELDFHGNLSDVILTKSQPCSLFNDMFVESPLTLSERKGFLEMMKEVYLEKRFLNLLKRKGCKVSKTSPAKEELAELDKTQTTGVLESVVIPNTLKKIYKLLGVAE